MSLLTVLTIAILCQDIHEIVQEAVEYGSIDEAAAVLIIGRCQNVQLSPEN